MALLIASCSRIKLSYGFLDNWLRWQTNDYFTPNREQKTVLKQLTKEFHTWHRANELLPYADFLAQTRQTLDKDQITQTDVTATLSELETLWLRSAQQLHIIARRILPTLTEGQKQEIIESIKQQLIEYQDEQLALNTDEFNELRLKRMQKQIKEYVGRLSDEQETLLQQWASNQKNLSVLFLHQQLIWLSRFEQALDLPMDQNENIDQLVALIFEAPTYLYATNPSFELAVNNNRANTHALILRLHQTLQAKQKRKLLSKLKRFENDFRDLASKAAQNKTASHAETKTQAIPLASTATNSTLHPPL